MWHRQRHLGGDALLEGHSVWEPRGLGLGQCSRPLEIILSTAHEFMESASWSTFFHLLIAAIVVSSKKFHCSGSVQDPKGL